MRRLVMRASLGIAAALLAAMASAQRSTSGVPIIPLYPKGTIASLGVPVRWSRLFGQFGGEVKLIRGFVHAAIWSDAGGGASPTPVAVFWMP